MHLDMQKGVYYAQLKVPKDVQRVIGKTAFRRTLKTRDKLKAQYRAIPLVQQWKAEIKTARLPPVERLKTLFTAERASIIELEQEIAKPSLPRAKHAELVEIKASIESIIEQDILAAHGAMDSQELSTEQLIESQATYMLATGQTTPFLEHLDAYLEDSQVEQKTKLGKRAQITLYAKTAPLVSDATHGTVRAFIRTLSKDQCLANKTIKTYLSTLAVYFEYLRVEVSAVPQDRINPFKGQKLPEVNRKLAAKEKRRSFTVEDTLKLEAKLRTKAMSNKADDQDRVLYDVFIFAIYTGARREEIGQLTVDSVKHDIIVIADAKSPAGNRSVPLHSKLRPLVARLTAGAKGSDFLFRKLTTGKFGDRTDAIGKRFGRTKTALGYDGRYVFHSLRKTVATRLEQTGVLENVASDILGHEKAATLSYGLYSSGTSIEQMRSAVESIDYHIRLGT
jgi:integrase